MTSKHSIKAPTHVSATDHQAQKSLINRPSPGAPHYREWHHLATGSAYSLR